MDHLQIVATTALHRNVLAVLIADRIQLTYRCVILPVAGKDHGTEALEWNTAGVSQNRIITQAIFGGSCEHLDSEGYLWQS